MQHSSGLYKKIAKLNNPQEIEKWREERKRRYPTKENVEKKVAALKEKIERGEKMGLNSDKRNRDNMSGAAIIKFCFFVVVPTVTVKMNYLTTRYSLRLL